jgi:type IV pilus assembly protein PilC
MSVYVYKAVDSKGKMVKGEMEAASEVELTTQLAKNGYLPVSIGFKTRQAASVFSGLNVKSFRGVKKVHPASLVVFTREFATIINAAVPILEGLGVLAEQSEDPVLKEALTRIIADVQGGASLSLAMAKHPGVFSDLYTNTVMAGESGGVLGKVLLKLSQILEEDQLTRAQIKSALRYPFMVVVALFVALFMLSVFVIPQFSKIYLAAKVKLPLPTQIMIMIGQSIRNYWFITIPCIFALSFLVRWYINTRSGRFQWDGFKFRLGGISKVYTKILMLRFVSMLSVLYQAGLPVLKSMDIVGMTIGNVVLMGEIEKVKHGIADGKGISGGVLSSRFFPKLVGYMISVGEKSGSLTTMLDSICDYYTLETKTAINNLTGLIEPIMTLILGVAVTGMAMAIFLPMWGMLQVLRRSV